MRKRRETLMDEKLFVPISIKNFPAAVKDSLAHIAIKKKSKIYKLVIKACKEFVEREAS